METYPNSSFSPASSGPPAVSERPPNRLPWLLLLLLGVIALAFLPALMERIQYQRTRGEMRAIRETLPELNLKALGKASTLVYRKVKPSVVHIDTRGERQERSDAFSRMLDGRGGSTYEERGEASGVIVDEAGYIVTNFHVIERASEITVSLADHRTFTAKVVGVDPAIDLAVLEISAPGLIAATWGDSDKLEVGEMVWAIGNPFGLDQTITSGIVSAKERRGVGPSAYQEFLQTDVAVNPGNSGGPLVDINGDIVGINTAIIGTAYQGISFAIPSNLAKEIYEKIRATGKVIRGYLGVQLAPLSSGLAKKYRFPADRNAGAIVMGATRGSPAAEAGLQEGDIIVEWNNQPVTDDGALRLMVARTEVGAKVPVKLFRDGKEVTVEVTVTERPSQFR
jgi:serine protease Do